MSILQQHRRAGAEKHHEIDRHVFLDALGAELALVRQHHGPLDVVVGVGDELRSLHFFRKIKPIFVTFSKFSRRFL